MTRGRSAEVLYTFEAAEHGELSVAQGERVLLSTLDAPEGWVIVARALATSEAGLVPAAYVAEVQAVVTPARGDTGATDLVDGPLDRETLLPLADFVSADADLRWLADARHPDPDHQSRMLEGAMNPWATPAESAQYTGSGWFSGEAVHSFSDAQEDELAIEAGEPLYIRCDEPCAEGWRHASRMDGSVGLVVSSSTRLPARPPARPPALLPARPSSWPLCVPRPSPLASLPIQHVRRQPETYVKLHDILMEAPVAFEGWGGVGSAGLLRFAAGDQLIVRVGVLSRGWWLARSAASPLRNVVFGGGGGGGPRGVVPRHLLDTWWRKEAGAACSTRYLGSATRPRPGRLGLALHAAAGPWLRHARELSS